MPCLISASPTLYHGTGIEKRGECISGSIDYKPDKEYIIFEPAFVPSFEPALESTMRAVEKESP